jgi:hypothetical protein
MKQATLSQLRLRHDLTYLDLWQVSGLPAETLSVLWHDLPVSQDAAQIALDEFNRLAQTRYTLADLNFSRKESE